MPESLAGHWNEWSVQACISSDPALSMFRLHDVIQILDKFHFHSESVSRNPKG
jgi:hypothetical protein